MIFTRPSATCSASLVDLFKLSTSSLQCFSYQHSRYRKEHSICNTFTSVNCTRITYTRLVDIFLRSPAFSSINLHEPRHATSKRPRRTMTLSLAFIVSICHFFLSQFLALHSFFVVERMTSTPRPHHKITAAPWKGTVITHLHCHLSNQLPLALPITSRIFHLSLLSNDRTVDPI